MPSYGAVKDVIRKKAKKELSHIAIHMAENGGHMVEHHFTSMDHPVEQHVFGKGQHAAMMAHVGNAMGVEAQPEADDIGKAEGSDKAEIDE